MCAKIVHLCAPARCESLANTQSSPCLVGVMLYRWCELSLNGIPIGGRVPFLPKAQLNRTYRVLQAIAHQHGVKLKTLCNRREEASTEPAILIVASIIRNSNLVLRLF